MRERLKSEEGRAQYAKRQATVEPVFGITKEQRGFRRFSFRGRVKNEAEWQLVCLTHNMRQLHRARAADPGRTFSGKTARKRTNRKNLPGRTWLPCAAKRHIGKTQPPHVR